MAEAVAHLTTALELLAGLADGSRRLQQEFELQVTLGVALNAAKGWGSVEMGRAYARARELGRELGDSPKRYPALAGLWHYHENRAELDASLEIARELLALAQRHEDMSLKLLGHRAIGNVLVFLGKLDAALPHLERVISEFDPLKHSLSFYDATDTRVSCLTFAAWTLLFQGQPEKALRLAGQALALARALARPYNLAFALHVNCLFHQVRGDRATVEERSAELVTLATEQGYPHMVGTGTFFLGWAHAERGEAETGVEEMHRGLAAKRATGAELKVPYYLGLLARAYAMVGRSSAALPLLAEALERVETTGERWYEAELCRLRGEALVRSNAVTVAEVEACFYRAINLARDQGAKRWELSATTSLARLWAEHGERRKAYDLLTPVHAWFTEGFDTPDLVEAKALLDALL
jgi:predicted ATPase